MDVHCSLRSSASQSAPSVCLSFFSSAHPPVSSFFFFFLCAFLVCLSTSLSQPWAHCIRLSASVSVLLRLSVSISLGFCLRPFNKEPVSVCVCLVVVSTSACDSLTVYIFLPLCLSLTACSRAAHAEPTWP